MINKISNLNVSPKNAHACTPSFGFAKMNDLGRTTADTFGYQKNEFLDSGMFKKQGFFKKPLLSQKIKDNDSFVELCQQYGCSKNPKANAEFIKNQILDSRSIEAVNKKVSSKYVTKGISSLYLANYDNPELSLKDTKALLELAKKSMKPEEFVMNSGLLEVGTSK